MRANSNQLACLILLCWMRLQVWQCSWNTNPGMKTTESYENSRRLQKSKISFSPVVLASLEARTAKQCLLLAYALGLRGEGPTSGPAVILSPSTSSMPLSVWSLFLTSGHLAIMWWAHWTISAGINGYVAELPGSIALTLFFTPHFCRQPVLFVPCATQKWFNTCQGLINQWLTGNWAFLEDFCTVPKG